MRDSRVAALLEDIDKKFQAIKEYTADIPEMKKDIMKMKDDIDQIKQDINIIKVALKNKADLVRVEKIEKEVELLKEKIA